MRVGTAFGLGMLVGYLVAESRPRACATCGAELVRVTDPTKLPASDRLIEEIARAMQSGLEFYQRQVGTGVELFVKAHTGELQSVAELGVISAPA